MKNTNRLFFALLAAAALLFAAGCSDSSDDDSISTSDLAGTTWTYSETSDDGTYTMTLEFASGGQVTLTVLGQKYGDATYSVSDDGSTVTISMDGGTPMELAYSSGQLVGYDEDGNAITFTKS